MTSSDSSSTTSAISALLISALVGLSPGGSEVARGVRRGTVGTLGFLTACLRDTGTRSGMIGNGLDFAGSAFDGFSVLESPPGIMPGRFAHVEQALNPFTQP